MNRLRMLAVLLALALTVYHVPTVLTGRILASDAPVPDGWENVVDDAGYGVQWNLDGLYGLRLGGLTCVGVMPTAYFDVLGPFAPVRVVVASSTDPWGGSDPTWQLRFPVPTEEHPDAASFIPPEAASCEP